MIAPAVAIRIHERIAEVTGGDVGVREYGLLDGALASPYATFGGAELYPTPIRKAAHLGFSVISSHPFVDGNKRVGVVLMLTLLSLYGVRYNLSGEDVYRIGMSVAAGEMDEDELYTFLAERVV